MTAPVWTADQLEAAIPNAIKARDFQAVAALIRLLALEAPRRAQAVLDTLELGMTVADIRDGVRWPARRPVEDPVGTVRRDPATGAAWVRYRECDGTAAGAHAWVALIDGERFYRHHVDVAHMPVVPDLSAQELVDDVRRLLGVI